MSVHVIGNPVPTPEEMAQILGVSPERVAAVRRIMSAPPSRKSSKGGLFSFKTATKRPNRSRTSSKVRSGR